jgi:hypothetical protein
MAGTIVADNLMDGAGNSTSMDNAIYGSAKAWANFNGTNASIRASYNISSITRNGTGTYTVNFTNSLTDANYSFVGCSAYQTGLTANPVVEINSSGSPAITSSSFQFYVVTGNQAVTDLNYVYFSVFR